jgi:hypothetical protein
MIESNNNFAYHAELELKNFPTPAGSKCSFLTCRWHPPCVNTPCWRADGSCLPEQMNRTKVTPSREDAPTSWPSSSGLRGCRRIYLTILESADNALFKMARYVFLRPLRSELDGQYVEASSHEDTPSSSRWTGHQYIDVALGVLLSYGRRAHARHFPTP